MKNDKPAHEYIEPRIIDQIIKAVNWTVRIILTALLVFSIWPYIPKGYSRNDIPDKNFPILVLGSENMPEIINFKNWTRSNPRPEFWKEQGDGKAMMQSMVFSYSVAIDIPGVTIVTLKRVDDDHLVSAVYKIMNGEMVALSYHSMDPGIALVIILWFIAWGVLGIVRRIVFAILGRIIKR